MGLVAEETVETELLGQLLIEAVALLQQVQQVQLAGVWQEREQQVRCSQLDGVVPQNGFPE